MFNFNQQDFRAAIQKSQEENLLLLKEDIEKVKIWVEKLLTMFLESSANMSRVQYPGVEI